MGRRNRRRREAAAAALAALPIAPMQEAAAAVPELLIREAKTLDDVAAIHEFMISNAIPEMAEASVDTQAYMEHLYGVAQNGIALMAIENERLVGFLGLMPLAFSYSRERFFLDTGFWVLPAHRDGVAFKALLQEARGIADATQMIVKIVTNNPSRHRGARSHMARTADVIEYRPAGAVLSFYPQRSH